MSVVLRDCHVCHSRTCISSYNRVLSAHWPDFRADKRTAMKAAKQVEEKSSVAEAPSEPKQSWWQSTKGWFKRKLCCGADNSVADVGAMWNRLQPKLPDAFKVMSLATLARGLGIDGVEASEASGASTQGEPKFDEVKSQSAVKVAVVVRPMLPFEVEKSCKDIVEVRPPTKIRLPAKASGSAPQDGYPFEFDRVYRIEDAAGNRKLFQEVAVPVVERFCQGFNGTILAYGQTGSGKTFTMGTSASANDIVAREPRAMIPHILQATFLYIKQASVRYDLALKVSYVEIYNESILDLLAFKKGTATGGRSGLEIHERASGNVYISGTMEVTVTSLSEIAKILEEGNAHRSTAAHKMNAESSRSHAIVMLTLEQRAKPEQYKSVPQELRYLRSKFNLVDLAGSERQKDTGSTGDRFAEGVNINKGLLELGNCINALTEGNKRHVPYRNSKLTRVLQDSLGGNSETLFIACVSPTDSNFDQTLNTLRYASRARSIKNSLRLNNQLSLEEEVAYLREALAKALADNAELRGRLNGTGLAGLA